MAATRHRQRLRSSFLVVALVACGTAVRAADWPQWRGPNRDGSSAETGLLGEWPKEGPKLLWQVSDLGEGYSTPSVVAGRCYLLTNPDRNDEFVQARDVATGKVVWSKKIGKVGNPDQQPSYVGTRSTPTIEGDVLYVLGSDGDLVCMETAEGAIRWKKNVRQEFAGKPGTWAYSESPLIDGDSLIVTPGGPEATILALRKKTGELIWKTATPEADEAAYSSAIAVQAGGTRQYVQLLQKGLVGVDAKTGKLLWRYSKPISVFNANIPTPLAADGIIYVGSAGTGGGAVQLTGKDGVVEAQERYFDAKLPTSIGGTVKSGNLLFGTTGQALVCMEFATGELKWQERGVGTASICLVDGRLYLHGENGDVALVEPSADGYREKGRFTPTNQPKHVGQMSKAWPHPVVADGKLYIRDLGAMWCYQVSTK